MALQIINAGPPPEETAEIEDRLRQLRYLG